jgi:hypothetical protein
VPIDPNALALYQQDVLRLLRAFVIDVEELNGAARDALVCVGLEDARDTGHELAMLAYDDDGELLNPGAEEMVDAIHNGIVPDLEDARERVMEALHELASALRDSIASVEAIEVPPNAMVRVMTTDRLEEEAERTPPRSRRRR